LTISIFFNKIGKNEILIFKIIKSINKSKHKLKTKNENLTKMNTRMTAMDFMLMELQELQASVLNVLDNERLELFLRDEYELEEGEVLPGLEYVPNMPIPVHTPGPIHIHIQKKIKHKWTEVETRFTTLGYLNNVDPKVISKVLPNIPLNSIKMKYQNCLFLDKGDIHSSLCNYSKLHYEVWNSIKNTI
jgi:hypothetical protein